MLIASKRLAAACSEGIYSRNEDSRCMKTQYSRANAVICHIAESFCSSSTPRSLVYLSRKLIEWTSLREKSRRVIIYLSRSQISFFSMLTLWSVLTMWIMRRNDGETCSSNLAANRRQVTANIIKEGVSED